MSSRLKRRATGPRSRTGKARSARNALRHGLAVPLEKRTDLSATAHELAREIVGSRDELFNAALDIAQAEVELWRIDEVKAGILSRPLLTSDWFRRELVAQMSDRESMRLLKARWSGKPIDNLWEAIASRAPTEIEVELRRLAETVQELARVERYERRPSLV